MLCIITLRFVTDHSSRGSKDTSSLETYIVSNLIKTWLVSIEPKMLQYSNSIYDCALKVHFSVVPSHFACTFENISLIWVWSNAGVRNRDMCGVTSKTFLSERMGSSGLDKHFSKWRARDQIKAIQQCGLASSKFIGKSSKKYPEKLTRLQILAHLYDTEFPIHPG